MLTLPCQVFPEGAEANLGRKHLRAWALLSAPARGVPHSSTLTSLLDVLHNLGCEAPIVEGLGAFLGQDLQRIG